MHKPWLSSWWWILMLMIQEKQVLLLETQAAWKKKIAFTCFIVKTAFSQNNNSAFWSGIWSDLESDPESDPYFVNGQHNVKQRIPNYIYIINIFHCCLHTFSRASFTNSSSKFSWMCTKRAKNVTDLSDVQSLLL